MVLGPHTDPEGRSPLNEQVRRQTCLLWTDDEARQVVEYLKAGGTVAAISRAIGRTPGAVDHWVRDHYGNVSTLRTGHPRRFAYKPWTDAEYALADAMIAQGLTRKQVAAKLGRSEGAVIGALLRRNRMAAGLAPNQPFTPRPRWSHAERQRLKEMVSEGRSIDSIAKALGRSPQAVHVAVAKRGGWRKMRSNEVASVHSAVWVAKLLGMTLANVKELIMLKLLLCTRSVYRQSYRKNRHGPRYYITDYAVMCCLENPKAWPYIDPHRITDEDWRDFALQARNDLHPHDRLIPIERAAAQVYLSGATLRRWIREGILPVAALSAKRRFVRAYDLIEAVERMTRS